MSRNALVVFVFLLAGCTGGSSHQDPVAPIAGAFGDAPVIEQAGPAETAGGFKPICANLRDWQLGRNQL